MAKIRVLIVDDAVVIRKIVNDIISSDSELEVVGTAPNGKVALNKMASLQPDIVICDVEMPEMDGLQFLAELRKIDNKVPVLMFSSVTTRGAAITLDAFVMGATDYIAKPSIQPNQEDLLKQLREELIAKVKKLVRRAGSLGLRSSAAAAGPTAAAGVSARALESSAARVLPGKTEVGPKPMPSVSASVSSDPASRSSLVMPASVSVTPSPAARPQVARGNASPIQLGMGGKLEAVVIGVSTGGPNALAVVLPSIPADFPLPILIVQHMPPHFTRLLAERLSARTAMPVEEGVAGSVLTAGRMWLAPGNFHLVVEKDGSQVRLKTHQGPPENSCRPAVDVLFRSAAEVFGSRTLAVVLTGMGQDGLKGCEVIRGAGGQVIVQDEASSVVWGMPGYVAKAGLAQKVLPLDQIAPEIVRRVSESRGASFGRHTLTQAT